MARLSSQQRSDPAAACAVIDAAFAGKPNGAKRAYCEFLAAAIKHLSQQQSDCWGVTLFDWGVRLNAGWVECLILHPEVLRVLVKRDLAPAGTKLDRIERKRAPGCLYTRIPLSDISRALASLTESHRAALLVAARRPPENTRKAHSAGVTRLLGLPNPSYYTPTEPDIQDTNGYVEGSLNQVLLNRYERDPAARDACVRHHGTVCSTCGFDFLAAYGPVADGFVHVHHLRPLSEIGPDYVVNPVEDLRPVCPNCHAIIHRRTPPYSIKDMRRFLESRRSE